MEGKGENQYCTLLSALQVCGAPLIIVPGGCCRFDRCCSCCCRGGEGGEDGHTVDRGGSGEGGGRVEQNNSVEPMPSCWFSAGRTRMTPKINPLWFGRVYFQHPTVIPSNQAIEPMDPPRHRSLFSRSCEILGNLSTGSRCGASAHFQ